MNEGPGKNRIAMITIDLDRIEIMAAQGMNYTQIAAALDISQDTLERRREDQQGVQAAIDRGKAKGIAIATTTLMRAVNGEKIHNSCINAVKYFMNNVAGWSNNPAEPVGDTHKYFIVGEAKAESADAWVSQHKPTALPSQKEH